MLQSDHNKRKSEFAKRLAAYSAVAAVATAGAGSVYAAGVGTDIAPDEVMTNPSTFDIDFDGDGNPEFILNYSSPGPFPAVAIVANSSAGDVGTGIMLAASSIYGQPQADALAAGAPIGTMATFSPVSTAFLAINNAGGFQGAGVQHIGVRFTLDGSATPLFGWIRVNIGAGTTTPTISYIYYEDAGANLPAGQTPTAVTLSDSQADNANASGTGFTIATAVLASLSAGLLWWQRKLKQTFSRQA